LNSSSSTQRKSSLNWLLGILYSAALVLLLFYLVDGFSYYFSSFDLRPRHDLYKILKPGGIRSHGLGILGSLFLILLLTYSLRKRTRLFGHMGMLSNWLKVHIFMGISGSLFIILHSTFKLNGLVAVSFWSMLAVAISGVLGRYLYIQIPRNIQGEELRLSEVKTNTADLAEKIKTQYGLTESQFVSIEKFLGIKEKKTYSLVKLL